MAPFLASRGRSLRTGPRAHGAEDWLARLPAHDQNELILRAAGEGIYGLDLAGRVTFANPAAARLTGHSPDELLGESMHDLVHHTRCTGLPYPRRRSEAG